MQKISQNSKGTAASTTWNQLTPCSVHKAIVITGATSGIGFATAKELAGKGACIIGVGRSEERCRIAETELRRTYPEACISFLTADLSSMNEVARLACDIRKKLEESGYKHLDVLINNAGTVSSWYAQTVDGFELQFAVNHLAPFRLVYELLPLLEQSGDGRVIGISSGSHYRTRIHWNDILLRKHYNCLLAYKQSKLANVLFSTELNRQLQTAGSSILAIAADPGLVNTDIGLKGTGGIVRKVWKWRSRKGSDASRPALSIAYLATAASDLLSGRVYWKDCKPVKPSGYSQRKEVGLRLWALSEKMCGIKYKFTRVPVENGQS